jgi:hypothetical protein
MQKMKKRDPNLTSFFAIKKRKWDFDPPFSKKKKKCLYLKICLLRWINHIPSLLLTNIYPNPSGVICINTYSVDPFFYAKNLIWTGERGFSVLSSTNWAIYSWPLLCIILIEYRIISSLAHATRPSRSTPTPTPHPQSPLFTNPSGDSSKNYFLPPSSMAKIVP